MNYKRLFQTLVLNLKRSAPRRADYLRKKNVFGMLGQNVSYSPRRIPLYANLIRIHNDVSIAAGVNFVTHDISDNVVNSFLRENHREERVSEKVGCIEVMDNVFIGSNSMILYDVKIGQNTIIGAGSIVTKDIPPNSVAAGVPCKVIGSFDEYVEKQIKRANSDFQNFGGTPHKRGVNIPLKAADKLWEEFDNNHSKQLEGTIK